MSKLLSGTHKIQVSDSEKISASVLTNRIEVAAVEKSVLNNKMVIDHAILHLSPAQARELAGKLNEYAAYADANNLLISQY